MLGVVDLVDVVPFGGLRIADDPFATGPLCWILANPRRLAKPFAYRGRQRTFDVPDWMMV